MEVRCAEVGAGMLTLSFRSMKNTLETMDVSLLRNTYRWGGTIGISSRKFPGQIPPHVALDSYMFRAHL